MFRIFKYRSLAALAILAVAFMVVLGWNRLRERATKIPEPAYGGKLLHQWLQELDSRTGRLSVSATQALLQLGTNAVPWLLKEASVRDSIPKSLWIDLLERQPGTRRSFDSGTEHHAAAKRGLRALGTNGMLGVAQGLTNSNPWIRFGCVGLWELAKDYPGVLFQPLLSRLKDPEPMIRARAANALGMLQQHPEQAVPALTDLLDDPDDWVRCMAALGLSLYGPSAKPALPKLLKCLEHSNSEFYFFATNALHAIDPSVARQAKPK